ncbi:MAG: NAD(P)-binding domain-containing protein [Pseudomonadota bacterium]
MKYGVLGTGMVGHTLATKLADLGHEVRMGARKKNNQKAIQWANAVGGSAGHGTFSSVAQWADRIIIAIKGAEIESLSETLQDKDVSGKPVIDVTNPLDFSGGMPPVLVPSLSNTTSAGEVLQAMFPSAYVVKALNTLNHEVMVDPGRVPGTHDVFLCGDHERAKQDVISMLAEFGWHSPIDLGPLAAARGTEGLMPFWLRMYSVHGNADFNYAIKR